MNRIGDQRSGPATLRFDVVTGLTAAAVVLPKAMACATVTGLPVAVDLYYRLHSDVCVRASSSRRC